jgi:hypothetical protein
MTVCKTLAAVLIAVMVSTAAANDWVSLGTTPRAQNSGTAMVLGSPSPRTLYVVFGSTNKLYRYFIDSGTWDDGPADLPTGTFGAGAALTSDKSGSIYALTGGGTQAFWRYSISFNSWVQYLNIPAAVSDGGALAYAYRDGAAWVYAIRGNNSPNFYRFGPVSLPGQGDRGEIVRWRSLTEVGFPIGPGGCLAWIHSPGASPTVDTIFCIPPYGLYLRAYSPVSGEWYDSRYLDGNTEMAGPGAALTAFHTGPDKFLAALFGDQSGDNHDQEAGEKTILPSPEAFDHFDHTGLQGMGAAIASGDNYYYYAFFGRGAYGFYRAYYQPGLVDGGQSSDGGTEQSQPVLVSPNPVLSRSAIAFSLPEHGPCRLTVRDAAGRLVASQTRTLAAGHQVLAWREVVPPSRKLPAGIYLLRIEARGMSIGTRVVVK